MYAPAPGCAKPGSEAIGAVVQSRGSMDAQDDLAQDVSSLEALLSLRGIGKRVFRRDRNLKTCFLDGLIQSLILAGAGNSIVCDGRNTRPWFRRVDAVGICHPP